MTVTETPTDIAYLRNTQGGEVVYEGGQGTNRYAYRWAGAGDPEGGDIQGVARHLLSDPNLRRTMTNGILVICSEEEAEAGFQRQAAAYNNRVQITGPAAVAQHMQQTPDVARVNVDDAGRVGVAQAPVTPLPGTPQGAPVMVPAPAGFAQPDASTSVASVSVPTDSVAPAPVPAAPNLGDEMDVTPGTVVNVTEDGSVDYGPVTLRVTEGPPLSGGI